jgi:hypothetical protein
VSNFNDHVLQYLKKACYTKENEGENVVGKCKLNYHNSRKNFNFYVVPGPIHIGVTMQPAKTLQP